MQVLSSGYHWPGEAHGSRVPMLRAAPSLCWSGQAAGRQVVLLVEWQHLVVQQVSRRDRRFRGVEPGMGYLAIGVDIGLPPLVDASINRRSRDRPAQRPSGCRRSTCPVNPDARLLSGFAIRLSGSRWAVSISPRASSSSFFFSSAGTWASFRMPPSSANLASSAFRRVLKPLGTLPCNALSVSGLPDHGAARWNARRTGRRKHPACAVHWRCGPDRRPGNPWQI
jgi:hypothetical protein